MTAPAPLDLTVLLDDLERAHAAATRGPWAQNGADPAYVIGQVSEDGEEYLDVADTAPSTSPGGWERAEANSAAIVALHNAFPTLIAELRKRDAANPLLSEALRYYAERRTMDNPKGWAHVQRVLRTAIESGAISASSEQVAEAHEVLDRLVEGESSPAAALSPESVPS